MRFLKDKYKTVRGSYSRMVTIDCRKCAAHVCHYQKDGSENLRRMYVERIFEPNVSLKNKMLCCPKRHELGIKTIYEKEKRLAYRLFVDAVTKKIVRAS